MINSWNRRREGKKKSLEVQSLGVLGDGIADKIEKFRRGNGLDGKRRGPAVTVLSKRFQEHLLSTGTVIQPEMWGWDSGVAPESRWAPGGLCRNSGSRTG